MSNSQNVASPRQIAANRANAAKSTGPRTPEGRARSAQNARKHGFTAVDFTVAVLENPQDLDNLKADAVDFYQPENSQELYAVERIAITQLALLRISHLEAQLFAGCLDGDVLLGEGFERSAANSNAFSLAIRYAAQAERQYRRAVDDFNRLKALRPEIPNEPTTSDPAPAEELDETNPTSPEPQQDNPLVTAPSHPFTEPGPSLAESGKPIAGL